MVVPKKGGEWFVMIPDLAAGLALLNRRPKTTTSIGSGETRTYGEVARDITAMALGEDFDKAETALNDFVKTVAYLGKYGENDQPPKGALPTVTVVRVPEYRIWDRKAKSLKAFPRNIANSQPTTAGRMIVPHPPTETLDGQRLPQESSFLTEWKRILLKHGATAEPENVDFPRSRGGEAHCSSNTVRIPIVK